MSLRAEILRKVLAGMNMRSQAGKTLGEVTVHHPGFNFSDNSVFSPYPSVWNLQRLMMGMRFYANHMVSEGSSQTFVEYDKLTSDRFTFIASTEMHVAPALYNHEVAKHSLEARIKLHHVGTTSLSTTCDVTSCGQSLCTNINGVISIDSKTRSPKALPDWWVEKYKSHTQTDVAFRVASVAHPEGSACDKCVVHFTDTDMYQHSSFTSYINYCFNAAYNVATRGVYRAVTANMVKNNAVKFASLAFLGESVVGDCLDIYTWDSDGKQLEFDMRKGDQLVCYCRIEYYDVNELPTPNLFKSYL